MRMQERDRKILTLCYEQSFLEKKHFEKFLPSEVAARRRIIALENADLIYRIDSQAKLNTKLIRLTRRGIYEVEANYPYRIQQKRQIHPSNYFHDSLVIDVRLRLAELWLARWTPEALLGSGTEIPDGIITFRSGRKIFIEVENSLKSRKRFLDRLRQFYGQGCVLYITTNLVTERGLKRYITEAEGRLPSIALIPIESLMSPSPAIWSPDPKLSIFHAKEF
jgi:hypothetical protein